MFKLSYVFFWSIKPAATIIALLYLPGTLLHELSHLITASILRVPTGQLTLFPRLDKANNHFKLGSVQVGKTDPIRSSLIGAAPTLIGVVVLYFLITQIKIIEQTSFSVALIGQLLSRTFGLDWTKTELLVFFLIFSIGSTLHTSPSDRKAWPLLTVVLAVTLLLYLAFFKSLVPVFFDYNFLEIIDNLVFALWMGVLIQLPVIVVTKLLLAASCRIHPKHL